MIRYDLKCEHDHVFEAWFGSSDDFEAQQSRGLVACALCGSQSVEKALMTPGVPVKANARSEPKPMLSEPASPIEEKLREIREHVEANSDYVGTRFAEEARAMHVGEIEHRSIFGEATGEEAKSLQEDGVPVAPLPFMPRRNS